MLKSSLCDYRDAYILVKGLITLASTKTTDVGTNITNKKVTFKIFASFINCISEINNTQLDNAKNLDIVMPMNNLTEYSNNYAKIFGSLYQYCRDKLALDNNDAIINFTNDSSIN